MSAFFRPLRVVAFAALASLSVGVAVAQVDDVVERARDQGLIGEQADGFVGVVTSPARAPRAIDADLKARIDSINIKRRALYTDLSAQRGVTVNEVGAATACKLFATRVAPGEFFRDETNTWKQRGAAPATLPFCPQ